jgi:hypothetical protein
VRHEQYIPAFRWHTERLKLREAGTRLQDNADKQAERLAH